MAYLTIGSRFGHRPLGRGVLVYYGLPRLTHAMVTFPMALFIPSFYADELGLPLAGVGVMIAASRIFDVVTDPLVGILSDRSRSRFGRRKPWIAFGAPLLVLSTWMLFVPRGEVSLAYLLVWSGLLFLALTLFDLPYKAWGAELSADYRERSSVAAWREGFGAAGQALFLGALLAMGMMGNHDSRDQLLVIASLVAVTLPPLTLLALRRVPERTPEALSGEVLMGWAAMAVLLRNGPFLRTLFAVVLFGSGLMVQATLHRLVLAHVVERPEFFSAIILGEIVAALVALPLWMRISDRIGKHRAITLAALAMGSVSLFFPAVGRGDLTLYAGLIMLRGSGLAAVLFLANSIAADVVDHDTLASGKQRTGLYFALWGMAIKLAVALGVMLGTGLPALFGFVPTAAVHSPASQFALMAVYGWLPCLIMVLAFPLLWNFPITRERHREMRAEIEARRCV